jgi:uncharacterized protein HemY
VANDLKKVIVVIGGLLIGIGATLMVRQLLGNVLEWTDEYWIGLGIVLTVAAAIPLYFMGKGSG